MGESISKQINVILNEATSSWGIKVESIQLKNVQLPRSMQRFLGREAEAVREAKAKLILAEGEMKTSLALRKASINFSKSPVSLQLKYLQTLKNISAEKN